MTVILEARWSFHTFLCIEPGAKTFSTAAAVMPDVEAIPWNRSPLSFQCFHSFSSARPREPSSTCSGACSREQNRQTHCLKSLLTVESNLHLVRLFSFFHATSHSSSPFTRIFPTLSHFFFVIDLPCSPLRIQSIGPPHCHGVHFLVARLDRVCIHMPHRRDQCRLVLSHHNVTHSAPHLVEPPTKTNISYRHSPYSPPSY